MKSRWFEHKEKIIQLRKQGFSYGEIEKLLGVPRSTLSHWLRDIELAEPQKQRLLQNYGNGLIKARIRSAQVRRQQKITRLKMADDEAAKVLSKIRFDDETLELALAMLYMGEGSKNYTTSMGSSNPLILRFFVMMLIRKYNVEIPRIRCDLHLRSDQNPQEMKAYWSAELGLPLSNFRSVIFDLRTSGVKSYSSYRGVCLVNCGSVAIQRKLVSLYNQFCQKALE